MNRIKSTTVSVILGLSLISAGCATQDEFGRPRPQTDAEKGAVYGAVAGAVIGGLVSKKRTKGALVGAVGGGLAGAAVGSYMDSQKRDFEQVLAPEVNNGSITIEKLPQNALKIVMTSQTAFDTDSAAIKPAFGGTMDKVSKIVNKYGKTALTIVGHTDSTGSTSHNQELSERRARSVYDYFSAKNVAPERMEAHGRGASEPRASNTSAEGRQKNRRVEILIEPVVAQS